MRDVGPERTENSAIVEAGVPADLSARITSSSHGTLQAVNVLRAEAGVPALTAQPDLIEIASARAADLVMRSYLGHEDPDTGELGVEKALAGIRYSGPAAELLFETREPLEDLSASLTEAWFGDPMHKALLLEPSFRYCGIGVMGDGDVWKISMVLTVGLPEEVQP